MNKSGNRKGCAGGVVTSVRHHESAIREEWTRRATEKNDRIVGKGYAERQIKDTLSKVEKINTEL